MSRTFYKSKQLIPFIFLLISLAGQTQTRLEDIDKSRIRQKSIRNFLTAQVEIGIVNVEDFKPSVDEQTDSSLFDSNVHYFRLQHGQASTRQAHSYAWKTYLSVHPSQVWQGKVVSCGFVYSPQSKQAIFPDDPYPGLETGQVFFIEMRVFFGLVRFPVCFLVTQIDESQQAITFTYIASGLSKGAQKIQLTDNGNGETQIRHSSIHQTQNAIRDKTLYPIYHKKAISEVHRNIRKLISKSNATN